MFPSKYFMLRKLQMHGLVSKRVPVHDLEVGSYILVRASEAIPVDGEVCQGISMVTVEHLTGEANTFENQVGDGVPCDAGNLDGMLIIKATKTWKMWQSIIVLGIV